MDVINRLKNTITNVVTGNPLIGEFEINSHRASGGPGMMWKVFDGLKRSTKQDCSIFIFEKKQLDRYSRRDRDLITDVFKKGVMQLTKLRHPKILSVIHPVEESRDVLAFATEPVFMSLANVLGNFENLPGPVPPDIRDFKLYDVEIKYGLLHLTEGLSFLHNDVKMVHNGLSPEAIFINRNGAWKLSGFDFSIPNGNQGEQAPFYAYKEWQTHLPHVVQPRLDYLAPEYTLTQSCDTASDMYSLGVLLYAIFNGGKTIFECRNEWTAFKKNAAELKHLKVSVLGSIPQDVRDHVKMLLNHEPSVRPDADQITKIPFFEDVGAMTLQYLDSLVQRDNLQKSQFFKGIPKILSKLPKRVCLQRILPCLFSECTNPNMIPFVLPSIFIVAESCSETEFAKQIMPGLVPIFRLQDPVQITLVCLQNMTLLLSKTPQNDIRHHVLPMVYRAMESGSPQIQELCLSIIPTFASLVEYSQMKSSLVPRLKSLCLSTSTLRIRVNSLVCLGKLLEYMDKWYVLDEILPILAQIPSREPAVLMSMLGIYKVAFTHKKLGMTKEVMAAKVLPFLITISVDNNLNLQQFNAYIGLVKDMIQKVETEHRAKLEQLNSMQQEQRTLQQFAQETFQEGGTGVSNGNKEESMMDKFMSGFGLGGLFSASSNDKKKTEERNPLNDMADIPTPKPEDTQLPNKPAKVNLTMEEKARLAKDQENLERLKQQPRLQPKAKTPTTTKSQVKDLTSSLMSTDFMGTQTSKSTMGMSPFGGNTGLSTGSSMPMSSGFGMGGMSSGISSPMSGNSMMSAPMSGPNVSQGFGQPVRPQGTQNKPVDMSAFDNLLPSKPKMAMNQMQPTRPTQPGFGQFPQQGTMGNMQQGPMGNMQQGAMGNMIGGQRMMGSSGVGMMGNMAPMGTQGMMGMQGMMTNPSFGQSSMNSQQNGNVKKLSNQDLADFLG